MSTANQIRTLSGVIDELDDRQQRRFELGLALLSLGHKQPGKIIDNAQTIADQMAAWEEADEPHPENEWCPVAEEAASIQEAYPALWDFVTSGHIGGGS